MIKALDTLVESRIQAAQREGQFDNLPGRGAPLPLDDDRLVPESMRMAYRILRNAGMVPPVVEQMREIASLRSLVQAATDPADKARASQVHRRLQALTLALEARGVDLASPALAGYGAQVRHRLLDDA